MAKEWAQFLRQKVVSHPSTMPGWRNAAAECRESESTTPHPQNQFAKHGLCHNRVDDGGSHDYEHAPLPTTSQTAIEYHQHSAQTPTPTNITLLPAQQLSLSQAIDTPLNVFDIMDSLSLQRPHEVKLPPPHSITSSCGDYIQVPGVAHAGMASSDSSCPHIPSGSAQFDNILSGSAQFDNIVRPSKSPASSTAIDPNSNLVAGYNDILSCTPTSKTCGYAAIDHKPTGRYNNFALGIGPSQNYAITGSLDRKLAASYNEILSGTCTPSRNDVSVNADCTGAFNIDTVSMQDSKLASIWLASGGSQDLSPEEKEMIYRAAAMQPIDMTTFSRTSAELELLDNPKPRRNVRISKDPQSIAARQRRQRISSKMRALQKLVPGGMKMDTASMLEEAANYLKFLKAEVEKMEALEHLINVAKGNNLDCIKHGQATSLISSNSLMKAKNNLTDMPLIPSGSQGSQLCNPPSSQYPPYLIQAPLTF